MKISKKTWQGFIERLRKIDDRAAEKVVSYMLDHDWSSGEGRKALLDYAFAVATKYGEGAAEMACQMYDAVSEASPKRVPPAEPAKTATYGEVARAVNGSLLFSPTPESAGAAVGRMVKTAGVDTTIQNAIRDGAEWAWIPSGDSCTFCMVLASQGWVRASKNVLKGGHASHIHNNCDCTFAVRHDGVSTVEGYDPDGLRAWWDAAEGRNSAEKLNYLRRQNYATRRDAINAQKRTAYARRNVVNEARAIDSFKYENENEDHKYTSSDLLKELQSSPIGIDTIRSIRDSNVEITISDEMADGKRGEQKGNQITLYSGSCRSRRVAGQTLIHEVAHHRFDIGGCQHAEAICFAMEKMHKEGRDYLTKDEWEYVKKLAIDNYPEYNWEKGGYGDYGQFNFVRR